jgi:hypothetical protein
MQIDGVIRPLGDGAGFSREAWCQFVGNRPEFRRYPSRQQRNPFTGETMTVQPPADAAEIMLGGRAIGKVYWSMSDEPLVNVSVESSGLSLVRAWAAALGGEFCPESSGTDRA